MEPISNPIEVLTNFSSTPNLIIGTVLILLLIAALAYPSIKALRGTWRSWVLAPAGPTVTAEMAAFGRHRWPYMLLCLAVGLTLVLPSVYFEAARDEHMRQLWWNLPFFWVPWLLGAMALFWWPRFATPEWNRDFERRRKEDPNAIPFTDEEIARIVAMPEDSKRRRRLLRNVRACRLYAAGHQNAYVR